MAFDYDGESYVVLGCGKCGITFCVPERFYDDRKKTKDGWSCPNGHVRYFTTSTEEKLRGELARQKIIVEVKEKRIDSLKADDQMRENRERGLRGCITRLKNKLAKKHKRNT